jgi:predicted RNase H-like nuclease (RuvC/YqgF family)
MPRPKGEPTTQVRLTQAFVSEVQEFQAKTGIKTVEEAIKLYSDKDWKRALVQREGLLKQKSDKECDVRVRDAVASFVKQVTVLENDMKALNSKIEALNSEIGKLKWQLKANADIARAEIVQKDAELTEKDSEIAKLKAEREKGPSSEIMKEHSEMKETIQSLELKLNEALKGKTESPSLYDDDWLPEYWPFANMEEYRTWFESE